MDVKTIKGIDEETWMKFKMLAVKRRVTKGRLLTNMVETYDKSSKDFWDEILHGKRRIISDKEAEEMHKVSKKIRKEWGFRRELNF